MTAEGWRSGTNATFGIHVDGIDGVVGGIGVRFLSDLDDGCAEIGYWVAAEARGRGVATAATRAAARWAFGAVPELARIQLRADVENVASNRVAEKAGFTREGVLRAQRYNARLGRRADFAMWSLLARGAPQSGGAAEANRRVWPSSARSTASWRAPRSRTRRGARTASTSSTSRAGSTRAG